MSFFWDLTLLCPSLVWTTASLSRLRADFFSISILWMTSYNTWYRLLYWIGTLSVGVCDNKSFYCNPPPFLWESDSRLLFCFAFGPGVVDTIRPLSWHDFADAVWMRWHLLLGRTVSIPGRGELRTLSASPIFHSLTTSFSCVSTDCWLLCAAALWRHCLADSCFNWQKKWSVRAWVTYGRRL